MNLSNEWIQFTTMFKCICNHFVIQIHFHHLFLIFSFFFYPVGLTLMITWALMYTLHFKIAYSLCDFQSLYITQLLQLYRKSSDITWLSQENFSYILVAKTTKLTTQTLFTAPGRKCAQLFCNNTPLYYCHTYSNWSMVKKTKKTNPIYRDTVHTQSYQKYHKKSFRQQVRNNSMVYTLDWTVSWVSWADTNLMQYQTIKTNNFVFFNRNFLDNELSFNSY